MKFIGYVTVRLNSKRVPRKSIRRIGNKPLVSRAIETLGNVSSVSDIVLYASQESLKEYIDPGLEYRFVRRDPALDSDDTTFNDVLDSIIDQLTADYLVFLSCTAPFIKPHTIQDMITHIEEEQYDSAFTANAMNAFCWFDGEPLNYDPGNVPRTQDLVPLLVETSSLYIFSKELYTKLKRRIGFRPYVKPVDLLEGWDIDTPQDFKIAEMISALYDT